MRTQVICTVDVVLLTLHEGALQVGLLKREQAPFDGAPALPGGYVHADEDQDCYAAAARVLRHKAGLDVPYLEQLATFSGGARDPRGWSVSIAYLALVAFDLHGQAAHADLRFVPVDRLPELPFDHRAIVEAALARLRSKSQYSSLPCYLAGDSFTLPQLQHVYEVLMGETINKVSFRRKMSEMDMLDPLEGRFAAAGAHRPAQLYCLKPAYRSRLMLLQRGL